MKKFAMLASVCFALFCLAATAVGGEKLRLGYSCSNFNDIFQIYIVEAAKAAAASGNAVLDVMDAQEDVIRQQDQVNTMIEKGVDALIVVPVDTSAIAGIEAAAKTKNLPVIYVNRNPYPNGNMPENVYFIGADSILEGETQMNYIGKLMGGKGNVVILMGILSNEGALNRTQGVHNIIKEKYPEIKVLAQETGNWQKDQGMTVMENWITAYGDKINAVFGNNDNMTLGAITALENAGIKGVYSIGIDATPEALQAILADQMTATVLQDPVAQGAGAVEMAAKILAGQKVPNLNKLPANLITKENAQAQLDKTK